MNTFEEIKPSRARKPPRQKGKDHFSDTPYSRPKEVRPSPVMLHGLGYSSVTGYLRGRGMMNNHRSL